MQVAAVSYLKELPEKDSMITKPGERKEESPKVGMCAQNITGMVRTGVGVGGAL